MTLFKQNNEDALLARFNSIRNDTDQWAIYHLRGSEMPRSQQQELFSDKAKELYSALVYNQKISPYFCPDKDIFFLFSGTKKHTASAILDVMHELFKIPNEANLLWENYSSFHALAEHYSNVLNMIEQKHKSYSKHKDCIASRVIDSEPKAQQQEYTWSKGNFKYALMERELRHEKLILIVDDDENVTELVRSVLRRDYRVRCASNAMDAMKIYNLHAPDMVFLDIKMPGISGMDFLQDIMKRDPDANILMFSARKTEDNVIKALQYGAKGFVGKPFKPDTLYKYAHQYCA